MQARQRSDQEGTRRYQEVLETAARLICAQGYEATSMQDIADGCRITKAGLYHHIESKEQLLLAIMDYGMDLFEEKVLSRVEGIADPLERLKACMELNIKLMTRGWSKEVTIILHEHATLTGRSQTKINLRKKSYVRFLERAFAEAIEKKLIRKVDPKLAAFSMLGSVLWIYKWYRPNGALTEQRLSDGMVDLFFNGLRRGNGR